MSQQQQQHKTIHRRDLLKAGAGAALAAAGLAADATRVLARGREQGHQPPQSSPPPPGSRLNIAIIGAGGQGAPNIRGVTRDPGVNIVAICDVDDVRAKDAYARFPQARKFTDFRRMYDAMEREIDAVVISTPDHTHFHPAYRAIEMGKHVYLEKPMAHDVREVRRLTELAAKKNVATQLGVQRHTLPSVHQAVHLIQAGVIGSVREVHSWVGSSAGRGMVPIPADTPPVPAHLDWDLWLGPAEPRPYHPTYAPYGWRFWWDFGTGESGNWGCHILDIPYWALNLKYPVRVDSNTEFGAPPHPETTPLKMHVTYIFPAEGKRAAFRLHWYHGTPPILKERGLTEPARGMNNLFIGGEGMLLAGFSRVMLMPGAEAKPEPSGALELTIPKSPGFHKEWLDACRGGKPATCHFGYTGPMTETVLLGNAAYRAGGGFDWDAKTLNATGNEEAGQYIRAEYRKGWEL